MKIVPIKATRNEDAVEVLEGVLKRVKSGEIEAVTIVWVGRAPDNCIGGVTSGGAEKWNMLAALEYILWDFKTKIFDQG